MWLRIRHERSSDVLAFEAGTPHAGTLSLDDQVGAISPISQLAG